MKKILISCLCLFSFTGMLFSQNSDKDTGYNLKTFLDEVAKKIQKNIIYDSSVQGRKIFVSNIPWDKPEELQHLFLSVLEHSGYFLETIGEKSEVWKIKRNIQGPWTQTPIFYSLEELNKVQNQDQFITMLIPVNHISAKEIQIILRALRFVNPQGGNLCAIEEAILVTDYAPNVKRVYELIRYLDQRMEREDSQVMMEGQNIALPLQESAIFLTIQEVKNASVVFLKKDGNVIAHIDEGKHGIKLNLAPFIKECPSFQFFIHVLGTGKAQCNIRIEAKSGKESMDIWGLSLCQFLKKGRKISFSVNFKAAK